MPALLAELVQSMLPTLPAAAPQREMHLREQRVAYLSSLARRMLAGGPRSHAQGAEHSIVQQAKKDSQWAHGGSMQSSGHSRRMHAAAMLIVCLYAFSLLATAAWLLLLR